MSSKTALVSGSSITPYDVVAHPGGKIIYSINNGSQDVALFLVDGNGAINYWKSITIPGSLTEIKIHPDGHSLFVADLAGLIYSYKINSVNGDLSYSGNISSGGTFIHSITISPNGRTLYSLNAGTNDISQFNVNQNDGTLQLRRIYTTGNYPFRISLTPDSRHLYSLNRNSQNIYLFNVDPENSDLTLATIFPLGADAFDMAVYSTYQ